MRLLLAASPALSMIARTDGAVRDSDGGVSRYARRVRVRVVAALAGAALLGGCGADPPPPRTPPPTTTLAPAPAAAEALTDPASWERWRSADYLVVGPSALLAGLEPWLRLRESQGHVVAVVTSEVVERRSSGRLDAESLRSVVALVREHAADRLRFVFLVGDAPAGDAPDATRCPCLPTFYKEKLVYTDTPLDEGGLVEPVPAERYPTDRPYAVLAPSGTSPGSARLAVGRLPAQTLGEVRAYSDRVVAYETGGGGAWQRRLALVAGPARLGPVADQVLESAATQVLDELVSYDWDVDVTFASEGSPYAGRPDGLRDRFVGGLARGALVAAYVGHGSATGFDTVSFRGGWFELGTTFDAMRVRIAAGFPLFFSIACDTGAFDLPGGRRSLGEALVMNPAGPIAVVASSRLSHPYPNLLIGEAIVDAFLDGRAPTVGEGLVALEARAQARSIALAELLVRDDIAALRSEHEELYNLLGDPGVRLRYPAHATVTLSAARPRAGGLLVPGEEVGVEVRSELPSGAVTITVETPRSVLAGEPVGPAALAAMPRDEALRTMEANRALAERKVVWSGSSQLTAGVARLSLALPDKPGRYLIKALVAGARDVATGHAAIEVVKAVAP